MKDSVGGRRQEFQIKVKEQKKVEQDTCETGQLNNLCAISDIINNDTLQIHPGKSLKFKLLAISMPFKKISEIDVDGIAEVPDDAT